MFSTELPPLVSDPDFWCKAVSGLERQDEELVVEIAIGLSVSYLGSNGVLNFKVSNKIHGVADKGEEIVIR